MSTQPEASPFFQPSTPHVVVVQRTPRGSRRVVKTPGEVKENKSTVIGCTANLINAIVGSGIVGIAYAVKQAGFAAGVFLVILTAMITEKSLRLLISTAKHIHVPTYEMAAEAAFGLSGFRFIAVSMFIMAYGAMLSYLMIVKESASMLFGVDPEDYATKRALLVAISLAIMVPLSCQRDMASLAATSRMSVVLDSILVAIVAYNAPIALSVEEVGGWSTLLTTDIVHWETVFMGIGVLSFAFVCQHSAFIIAGSLDHPTTNRWSIVTASSLSVCVVLALASGAFGYLGYQDETDGNILSNLPETLSGNIARTMLGTTMLFVYPMESFVARHAVVVLVFKGRRAHEGDDAAILNRRDRRIGLTVLLYLSAVIPAALSEDLGYVLAVVGALSGSCLSYIGPGLLFMGIHGARFLVLVQENRWFGSIYSNSSLSNVQNSATPHQSTEAVETTPLVASIKAGTDLDASKQDGDFPAATVPKEAVIVRFLSLVAWYASGMPIWCMIAGAGEKGVTNHIEEMALKSPHPIRIGDVEYRRVSVTSKGTLHSQLPAAAALVSSGRAYTTESSFMVAREHIRGQPRFEPTSSGGVDINQQIGKQILEKQQQQNARSKPVPIEKDPHETPPGWGDFFVAILFVLYGVLAMVAGLISIFYS